MPRTPGEVEKVQKHLSLLREEYVRLQEKCIALEQKLALVQVSSSALSSMPTPQDSFPGNLLKFVVSLYDKEEYSDLIVKLCNGQVRAHKFVLAARGYFWGVASLANVDSLDWTEFDEGVGTSLLRWLYTDHIQLTDNVIAEKVIRAAAQFQLKDLVKRCEEVLISCVSFCNCILLYTTAEEIEAETLKAHCSALISTHWNEFTPDDFDHMSAPLLYSMVKSKTKYLLHTTVRLQREDVLFLFLIEYTSQLPTVLDHCDDTGKLALDLSLERMQWSIANTLLKHGASVNALNDHGDSPLYCAVTRGDDSAAKFLIEYGAGVNMPKEKFKQLPLHVIAVTNYRNEDISFRMLEVAKMMIKHGVNVNFQDINLKTALHLAVEKCNRSLFKILLECPSINLNVKDEKNLPPLWYTLLSSDDFSENSFAFLLIKNGARVDEKLEKGNTLLHLVADEGLEEAGIYLTTQGVPLSIRNSVGETPLHLSCTTGLPLLTTALLQGGADPNHQTFVPSPTVTQSHDIEDVKAVDREESVTKKVFKETPLHRAIRYENFDDAMAILHHKALCESSSGAFIEPLFDLEDSEDLTCLGVAVMNASLSVAQQILLKGADINQIDDEGRSLFHRILGHKSEDTTKIAKFLIANGIDPNRRDINGYSPLQLCIQNCLPGVVESLCKCRADFGAVCPNSLGPLLWYALISGQEDIAEILVRYNIDVDSWATGPEGCMETLLHRAIDENREDIACFLIQSGAAVNALRRESKSGIGVDIANELQTPLHMCCSWGLVTTARMLIQFGGEVNVKDCEGKTPVHIALENNHAQLVELILEQPSLDLGIHDLKGMSPFSIAMAQKNNRAAQSILMKYPPAAEQYDHRGLNYLHTAIQKKDLESVLFLLSIHVNLSSRTKDGRQYTPLHLATLEGNEIIVRNLLLAGASVNELTSQKETCLHLCSLHDRHALAIIFIQNEIAVDCLDDNQNNALHVAIKEGHLTIVRVLLTESRINAGAVNLRGQNPLHVLAASPKENAGAIAQLFLDALPQYPINNVDVDGNTALLLAYIRGSGQLCRVLVRSGACLGTVNKHGIHLFNYEVATKALLRRLLDSIAVEPPWSEGEICLECSAKFGLATRRHHCRHCGRVLCAKCSGKDIPILKFGINKPVRVCQICFDVLTLGPSGS